MANARKRNTTVKKVMMGKGFSVGYNEAKKGKPLDVERYADDPASQWRYERGRQFAICWGGILKNGHRLRIEAMTAFSAAYQAGDIV